MLFFIKFQQIKAKVTAFFIGILIKLSGVEVFIQIAKFWDYTAFNFLIKLSKSLSKAYSEPCQTSKLEPVPKIVQSALS